MLEARVYRSEFIIYECPYCHRKNYRDTADMLREGELDGMTITCEYCNRAFYLREE